MQIFGLKGGRQATVALRENNEIIVLGFKLPVVATHTPIFFSFLPFFFCFPLNFLTF